MDSVSLNANFQFCPKGHELTWSQGYFDQPCPICKTNTLNYSRWECNKCGEKYCVGCKKPTVYPYKCPLNHELVEKELHANMCDACRKSINGKAYRDKDCDFDLCMDCIKALKMSSHLSDLLSPHAFCPKGHDLIWVKSSQPISALCPVCQTQSTLIGSYYKCALCNDTFCLNCRKPLLKDETCPNGHKLKLTDTTKFIVKCNICMQVITTSKVFKDSDCLLNVCERCKALCGDETSEYASTFLGDERTLSPFAFDVLEPNGICFKLALTERLNEEENKSNDEPSSSKYFFNSAFNDYYLFFRSNTMSKKDLKLSSRISESVFILRDPKIKTDPCKLFLSSGEFYIAPEKLSPINPVGIQVKKYTIRRTIVIMKIGETFMRIRKRSSSNLTVVFYDSFPVDRAQPCLGKKEFTTLNTDPYIGKSFDSFLQNDSGISRQHLKIHYELGEYTVYDHRSRTGLFLILVEGDQLSLFENFKPDQDKSETILQIGKKVYNVLVKPLLSYKWPMCEKQHPLKWSPEYLEATDACPCNQTNVGLKMIYWICEKCHLKFCVHLRPASLFPNKRCPYYHKFKKTRFTGKRTLERKHCHICFTTFDVDSLLDEICGYEICTKCKSKKPNE